ncbi:MAG: cytochrome [Rhodocyclales bacterium]|nr:cytochrome [Rhodocyclales bacterium]
MKLRFLAIVALAFVSTLAQAQSKPEDMIRMRQGGMNLLSRNVSALNAMSKGDVPYNKDVAMQKAEFVNMLASEIFAAGFGPGSDKGLPTRAKPSIWTEGDSFKAGQEKLLAALKKVQAGAGDLAALKTAMGDVGGTCKGCHDNYRDSSYH